MQVEHYGQRAARLEAPSALKKLFLEPHFRRRANSIGERVVDQVTYWCRNDEITKSRAIGADGIDGRRGRRRINH